MVLQKPANQELAPIMDQTYYYDVVLSFAGEDRGIVEKVRDQLREQNIKVFYDHDEQHDLLGKNLAEHFIELYQNAAQFCVIFVSESYLRKPWCKWERQAALARAFKSKTEYIIPYVLSDVSIPGIPETIGRAHSDKTPPQAFANLLVRKLKGSVAVSPEITSVTEQLSRSLSSDTNIVAWENTQLSRRISTNFSEVDIVLGTHLRSGTIYGVGSRPSMGKTAFALNMATRLSQKGIPVGFVTIDQPTESVVHRLLGLNARVDVQRLHHRFLTTAELARVAEANERLSKLPLRIIDPGDRANLDVMLCELWAAIDKFKLRIFFVDSLTPISATNLFGQYSRNSRVRALTSFKWLAQETHTTGVVSLPLSRAVEVRADRIPVVTDVRGGKNVSRLFESVFLLHRPNAYDPAETDDSLQVFVAKPSLTRRLGPAELVFHRNFGFSAGSLGVKRNGSPKLCENSLKSMMNLFSKVPLPAERASV